MTYLREEMGRRMDRYANEMESLRGEMMQTMDKYANHMGREVNWLLTLLQKMWFRIRQHTLSD
jgi:hypothetical protein